MFSPHSQPPATARTSRRRPRPTSGDSLQQPKAKRQRSTLNEQTFSAPNGSTEMEEVKASKASASAIAKRESTRAVVAPRRDLTVRGKKSKVVERSGKGDGCVVLTKNDVYSVGKLPAWPDRLQADSQTRQHGALYSDSGFALSLSHEHALVWPYANHSTTPETFVFELPKQTKSTLDTLPLGSLVSASASSTEPGLVVVMPTSGKVIYWESVTSAATLEMMSQQKRGIESSIPGMFSGETVIQILNAESAGFLLGFSSGRIAYMSVRDGQGRPAVSVQYLRGGNPSTGGGIFGSLRNVLSGTAYKGDFAAARAGPSGRPGERRVAAATTKGRLQVWDIHRGGHDTLLAEADVREQVVHALMETEPSLKDLSIDTFELHDLVFVPSQAESSDSAVFLLTSLSSREKSHFALVKIKLSPRSFDIEMVRHLKSYTDTIRRNATSKPRLHLPAPGAFVFVVLDQAVIVVSTAQQSADPAAQLLGEGHAVPEPFEDVIDFRRNADVEIVGSGSEDPQTTPHSLDDAKSRKHKAKHAALLILVRGFGVIRIAVTHISKASSHSSPVVTAKSKLEQAVFFGTQDNNPLSFRGREEVQFSAEQTSIAAMTLSYEIASSASPYIPSTAPSMEQHLRQRQAALSELANHLKRTNAPLDRRTRWTLLAMAEKVAAATKTWHSYDASLQLKPVGQKRGLFNDIVVFIHPNYKTEPVAESGELDRVRHWFIHDIYRFEIAIPWALQAIKFIYGNGNTEFGNLVNMLSEADFIIAALDAAFKFREEHLAQYGLQDENVRNGILHSVEDYQGLPEFWTSTEFITKNLKKQTELTVDVALENWQKKEAGVDHNKILKLRVEAPNLVDINTLCTTERFRWMLAQDEQQNRQIVEQGSLVLRSSMQARHQQIARIADLGLVEEAIRVAEKHKVFNCLAFLLIDEMVDIDARLEELRSRGFLHSEEYQAILDEGQNVEVRIGEYITRYRSEFANAMYRYYMQRGELHALITDTTGKNAFLTQFLRSRSDLLKISWINEVKENDDYDRASDALLKLAHSEEQDAWSKKVELSLGKLARLTGRKYSQKGGLIIPDGGNADLVPTNKELAMLEIQGKAYTYVSPLVAGTIDETAEIELAVQLFGNKQLVGNEGLPGLLEEKINQLMSHKVMTAVELIDLLTLINTHQDAPILAGLGSFAGQEFYMALQALQSGTMDREERDRQQRIIWRRCMIRDDWEEINDTDGKSDREVEDRLHNTALYSTLKACIMNRFFERPSTFSPISPSQCINAGTTDLGSRFEYASPGIREKILNDMTAESSLLSHYISTCQLEKWFSGVMDAAKGRVNSDMDKETEHGITMKGVADELEAMEVRLAEDSRDAARTALKGRTRYRPNIAQAGGFRTSMRV